MSGKPERTNKPRNKSADEAAAFARYMRPTMIELAEFSATEAAAILNERKLPSVGGRKWTALQVLRLRQRLAGHSVR
jgi:hypothetical protein